MCKTWLAETLNGQVTRFGDEGKAAEALALRLRIPVGGEYSTVGYIWDACDARGEDFFLDALDLALLLTSGRTSGRLGDTLAMGGSAWTVAEGGRSLVRRVSESQQESYTQAVAPADDIGQELKTAWAAVYGRQPDPSDAWDHAIKAAEFALWRIVTPDRDKATLGQIIDRLSKKGDQFSLRLETSSDRATSVETFAQMLRLIWPNPDRHGSGQPRVPTHDEAQNVVQLAVLITNWARSRALQAR